MNKKLVLVLIPVLVLLLAYLYSSREKKALLTLPYFHPKGSSAMPDSQIHRVADFQFIDQDSQVVTQQFIQNKIYVCDYFFVTCQSICPKMTKQMERVAEAFQNDSLIKILSHTVNPEEDSVQALKEYARLHHADSKQWKFLTGSKEALYQMARKSYLLNAEEGNGDAEDFIHTQNFALIDQDRRIRGFYDGTDSAEITRLIRDIRQLRLAH